MLQTVADAGLQTMIFVILFVIGFLALCRPEKGSLEFSPRVTNELKGFAILIIVLAHIGCFLFTDHSFLSPYSTIAGIGVDLFFLLSGYGLVCSAMKKNDSPLEFYKRRIGKIFVPLWIVLVALLVLDALLLRQFFDWPVILRSFFGIFPSADIYGDLNSPLWYLTPLLFFYMIFPWIFRSRRPVWSALLFIIIGVLAIQLPLPIAAGVHNLYSLHYLAFPCGVLLAVLVSRGEKTGHKLISWLQKRKLSEVARFLVLAISLGIFWLTVTIPGAGVMVQLFSIAGAVSVALIFILLKWQFRLFEYFGNYSYEIYLIHWPILYHYDFIYRWVPAGPGTMLYLLLFLGLAYLMRKLILRMSFV